MIEPINEGRINQFFNWMLDRLSERSSWYALFCLLGLIGYEIAPELQEKVFQTVIAIIAVLEFTRKENEKR